MFSSAKATCHERSSQVGQVLQDLPVSYPLYRQGHLHRGATSAEVAAPLPGDGWLPRTQAGRPALSVVSA
jgi:hypothetical protein